MEKLAEEQIEDILTGKSPVPDGVDEDSLSRLDGHRAVRNKLRTAAATIGLPAGLAERIRGELAHARSAEEGGGGSGGGGGVFNRVIYKVGILAAAAAILVVAGIFVFSTDSATAQARIARIHRSMVAGADGFHAAADPENISERLKGRCSSRIPLPRLEGNCSYAGWRIAQFRGNDVAVVLVEIDGKKVSIISVPDDPDSLHFGRIFRQEGRTWCNCAFEECRMAAVGVTGHTYIAAGEAPHEVLVGLLDRLVQTH